MGIDLENEIARFETAKLGWMAGGDALMDNDPLYVAVSGSEAQLRLLAQAAQIRQVCLRPEAPEYLTAAAAFPDLAIPLLAEPLRPMFRRLIGKTQSHAQAQGIISLMAKRGVMAHPFDWLPPKDGDGFPPAYAALSAWVAGHDAELTQATALTDESWDQYYPAERLTAFMTLRQSDPDAARDLLAARTKTVPAEERTRLVAALANRLQSADQSLLEELQMDRSGKVKAVARQLLGRLGALETDEDAQELADFLDVHKAMLSRKVTIGPRKMLNQTQRDRLAQLIQIVSVGQLADSLAIDTTSLATSWDITQAQFTDLMLTNFVQTGSDGDLRAYWKRMKSAKIAECADLLALQPRFDRDALEIELVDLINAGAWVDLHYWPHLFGPDVSDRLAQAVLADKEVTKILAAADSAAKATEKDAHKQRFALSAAQELIATLGLVLPRAAAIHLRDLVTSHAFHAADPALDTLNFNIALEGPTQ